MTERDEKLLAEFGVRMKQLMYLCDTLKEKNRLLEVGLSQKSMEVEALTLEVGQLKNKYDNLKFTKALSSENKEGMMDSKRKLSKLVRDVDKCIALLKG